MANKTTRGHLLLNIETCSTKEIENSWNMQWKAVICKGYRPEASGYVIYSPRALPEGLQADKRLRACLHGGGGPQVGEVTCLGGVKNNPPLNTILQHSHPGVHFLKIIEWSLTT